MSTINVTLPDLPYAVEEALNRLRVNIRMRGKRLWRSTYGICWQKQDFPRSW